MDDTTSTTSTTSGLKRRNSVPSAVLIPNGKLTSSSPSFEFKLVSFDYPSTAESYTSLKDIIPCNNSPSSMLSPTTPATNSAIPGANMSSPSFGSGYEISIRNRLVKQAAWAYLQPTVPSSPSSSSGCCICFSREFYSPIMGGFRELLYGTVTRMYDWLADVLWLILCR